MKKLTLLALALLVAPVASLLAQDYAPTASMRYKLGNNRTIYSPEIFMPLASDDRSLLFADLRSVISIPTAQEYNVGLGYRYFLNSDLIGGVYGFYDRRNSPNGNKFNQITAGAELLANRWDARVNTYVPLTRDAKFVEGTTSTVNPAGTSIYMTNGYSYEQALDGADIEFGYKPFAVIPVRVYGGGYWFEGGDAPTIKGTRARVELQAHRFLRLGGEMQYDHVRGHNSFVEARVTVPLSLEELLHPKEQSAMHERMTTPIVRDIDIVTAEESSNRYVTTALTTTDGTTSRILYVDNSGSNGDGSYENPYNNLSDAVASSTSGTVIYIREGNGTATGLTSAYTLSANGVKLLGAGDAYTLSDLGLQVSDPNNLLSSSYQLFDADGAPVLSSAGTALTITGNSVTVAGLTVSGTTSGGIVFTNTNGLTVRDVTLANIGGTAISGSIANMASSIRIENSRIVSSSNEAINVTGNGTASISLVMQGIEVSGSKNNGVMLTMNSSTQAVITLQNSTIENTNLADTAIQEAGRGLWLQATENSSATVNVTSNTIQNQRGEAMLFETYNSTNAHINGIVTGNTVSNTMTQSSGAVVNIGIQTRIQDGGYLGTATNRFMVTSNTIRNSSEDGLKIWGRGGTVYADVAYNDSSGNDDGMEARVENGGYVDANFYGNNSYRNVEAGIQVDAKGSSGTVVSHIYHNTLHDNGFTTDAQQGKGIQLGNIDAVGATAGTSSTPILVENNTIYNNEYMGIDFALGPNSTTSSTGSANYIIRNNIISNSGNVGIMYISSASMVVSASFINNTVISSSQQAMRIDSYGPASSTLNIISNSMVNQTNGIYLNPNTSSTVNIHVISNTIVSSSQEGIEYAVRDRSVVTGSLIGNTITSSTQYGFYGQSIGTSSTLGTSSNPFLIGYNTITSNTMSNLYLRTATGADPLIYARVYGNVLTGSAARGLDINEFDTRTTVNNITIDLGGGVYSSIGRNSILNNAGVNVYYNPDVTSSVLKAQNNWWGLAASPATFDEAYDSDGLNEFTAAASATIDAANFLTTAP